MVIYCCCEPKTFTLYFMFRFISWAFKTEAFFDSKIKDAIVNLMTELFCQEWMKCCRKLGEIRR